MKGNRQGSLEGDGRRPERPAGPFTLDQTTFESRSFKESSIQPEKSFRLDDGPGTARFRGRFLQASHRGAEPRRQLLEKGHPGSSRCRGGRKGGGEAPVEKGGTSSCCSTTAPPRVTSSRWTARHSLSPSRLEKVRVSRGEVP